MAAAALSAVGSKISPVLRSQGLHVALFTTANIVASLWAAHAIGSIWLGLAIGVAAEWLLIRAYTHLTGEPLHPRILWALAYVAAAALAFANGVTHGGLAGIRTLIFSCGVVLTFQAMVMAGGAKIDLDRQRGRAQQFA